jgi:hypothetical protein
MRLREESYYLLLMGVRRIVNLAARLPEYNNIIAPLKSHAQPPSFDCGVVDALNKQMSREHRY